MVYECHRWTQRGGQKCDSSSGAILALKIDPHKIMPKLLQNKSSTFCGVYEHFSTNKLITYFIYYFRRRLASGEGIVALGVRVCMSAEPRLDAVGGEGKALHLGISS